MDRKQASRLIENSQEIVFSNPVKGAYHMTREDIAWVSKWANLTYASELSADTPAQETIEASGKTFACERMKMLASTVTDPPVVPKQTIEFKGTVWRSDATPFGVVRAEWVEKTTKKDRNREETRRLTLRASGWETPPTEPVDRGKESGTRLHRAVWNRDGAKHDGMRPEGFEVEAQAMEQVSRFRRRRKVGGGHFDDQWREEGL